MKKLNTVLIEAIVIAFVVLLSYLAVKYITSFFGYSNEFLNVALAGSLVHIVYEYTGVNKYYVDNYYK